MWELERALKGVPFLADQPPEAVLDVFEDWHARSLPNMRGKNLEANWRDFKVSWQSVKKPGLSALREHVRARLESGWRPPDTLDLPESCRRVALVMGEMQAYGTLLRGRPDFFLSFALLAELAALSVGAAWGAVQRLLAAGLARVVRQGVRCSGGGFATVYEYAGEWPPMGLGDGAEPSSASSPSSTPSFAPSMCSPEQSGPQPRGHVAFPQAPLTYRPAVPKPPPTPAVA